MTLALVPLGFAFIVHVFGGMPTWAERFRTLAESMREDPWNGGFLEPRKLYALQKKRATRSRIHRLVVTDPWKAGESTAHEVESRVLVRHVETRDPWEN